MKEMLKQFIPLSNHIMKKNSLLLIASFLLTLTAFAQPEQKFPGTWEGKLNVGIELRIVFHLADDGQGGFSGTADSPDQSAFGFKCDTVVVSRDSIHISMKGLFAAFAGRLVSDSTIIGTFTQRAAIPLLLNKVDQPSQTKRPQTPQAPFPYLSEDVEYENAGKTLHYGATITIPKGNGPFPAAVLITGSGPQDRDETIMGHRTFAVLADALTKNGFAILRVDDRGVGKTTGQFKGATSADFATDVNASLDYLLSRPEVNKKKTGLIGHSEGGMIAPIVASQRKDIDFLVLLAAPGIKIEQLMAEQNAAILQSAGINQQAIAAYIPFYKNLMNLAVNSTDSTATIAAATALSQQWATATAPSLQKEMGFETDETRNEIVKNLMREFSGEWFRYFLAFDPQVYLQKVNAKVLALNGDKDIQVIAASNLPGIETALKKSKSKKYAVKTIPGLNHLFQTCKLCTIPEYGMLEETFSPAALQEINEWLNKYVK